MDRLPREILDRVAANLSTSDICRFRLVNRRFADVGFALAVQHVQVLNTLDCFQMLKKLQNSRYGSLRATQHITLYHGKWPQIDSFQHWAHHPQSLSGSLCSRWSLSLNSAEAKHAYKNYQNFQEREYSRDFDTDVSLFHNLIEIFPNVRSIRVSHIHSWRWGLLDNFHCLELAGRIWMAPFFLDSIQAVTHRLQQALVHYSRISHLDLHGTISFEEVVHTTKCLNVSSLRLNSLITPEAVELEAHQFLANFPNLQELILRGVPCGSNSGVLSLGALYWPNLRRVELTNILAPEVELLAFIGRHQLQTLSLQSVIIQGSWESFLTQLRDQGGRLKKPRLRKGWSATAWESVCLETFLLLRLFMSTDGSPWPFNAPYEPTLPMQIKFDASCTAENKM